MDLQLLICARSNKNLLHLLYSLVIVTLLINLCSLALMTLLLIRSCGGRRRGGEWTRAVYSFSLHSQDLLCQEAPCRAGEFTLG